MYNKETIIDRLVELFANYSNGYFEKDDIKQESITITLELKRKSDVDTMTESEFIRNLAGGMISTFFNDTIPYDILNMDSLQMTYDDIDNILSQRYQVVELSQVCNNGSCNLHIRELPRKRKFRR